MAGAPKKREVYYDARKDVVDIDGVEYTGKVFDFLRAMSAQGKIFRLAHDKDGHLTLQELEYTEQWGLTAKEDLR